MATFSRLRTSERGAVLVYVATGLIVFLAFVAFALDYGVKMASRNQVQNAADAGALAGALAYSLVPDTSDTGPAKQNAQAFAQANSVWAEAPDVQLSDITFPPCPDDADLTCVRVNAFRTNVSGRTNPLPTFFAQFVGVTEQGVRGTATAEIAPGNAAKCLLPFAVFDRWADYLDGTDPDDDPIDEVNFPGDGQGNGGTDPADLAAAKAGWSPNDRFAPASDRYRSPVHYTSGNHTGWTIAEDRGRQLILNYDQPGPNQGSALSPGWTNTLSLCGNMTTRENIVGCNECLVGIAAVDEPCPPASQQTEEMAASGCLSVQTGVQQGHIGGPNGGIAELVGRAPDHQWSSTANGGQGGIVDGAGNLVADSPRLRPLAVFDNSHYGPSGCSGTNCVVRVANIIGFFVEGMGNQLSGNQWDQGMQSICEQPQKCVVGRIVNLPGTFAGGAGDVASDASFVSIIRLVR